MKNYADLGECYPPKLKAEADNTLRDLHNSSCHTQPHPISTGYYTVVRRYEFYVGVAETIINILQILIF